MTDQTDDSPEGPDLDPATETAVRRLLADARHTEALPPEVAGRLDTLLGELVQVRSAESGVHSLDARRHRRRRLLLVAAAAAVVFGVAVPTIDNLGSSSGDESASSAADAPAADSDADSGADSSAQEAAPAAPAPSALTGAAAGPIALTADTFEAVVRAQGLGRSLDAAPAPPAIAQGEAAGPTNGCAAGDYGPGRAVAATYDGTPAVLVFRPTDGDRQVVDLLTCATAPDAASVIRSTTIPAS